MTAQHICAASKNQAVTVAGAETVDFTMPQSKCTVKTQTWINGTTVQALTGDDAAKTVNLPFYRHLAPTTRRPTSRPTAT